MATLQDLDAITEYIENARSRVDEFPSLMSAITKYEAWLGNLGWYRKYLETDSVVGEAKYFRDEVNSILGDALPTNWIPADAAHAADAPAKKPDLIPDQYKIAAAFTATGVVVLIILKKFRVI